MARIRVTTTLDVPPAEAWESLRDISSHVEWMADAESIEFTTEQTSGVGTTFDCVTRVGPIRLTDRIRITEWEDAAVMGVHHEGVVAGTGRFTLRPSGSSQTEFTWDEELQFPLWLGGPVGEVVAKPILTAIWKRNLKRLAATFA